MRAVIIEPVRIILFDDLPTAVMPMLIPAILTRVFHRTIIHI